MAQKASRSFWAQWPKGRPCQLDAPHGFRMSRLAYFAGFHCVVSLPITPCGYGQVAARPSNFGSGWLEQPLGFQGHRA
jgi:hypothetical protein